MVAIHQRLNLDRTCAYRLFPRFAGVRIVTYDPTKEIDVTIDETLEEWDKKVKSLCDGETPPKPPRRWRSGISR